MSSKKELWIALPYSKPPLSANQRLHWAKKSRITREVRRTAGLLVRAAKLGEKQAVECRVAYRPKDRRRRDASNLMPTQKACVDGLVDAGVVPDDCAPYVRELMPELVEVERGKSGALWFVVGWLEN